MDWRLMISVEAAAIFLYWCERVFRTFCSISLMKFTFLCYFTKRTDTMPRCKVSECEFSKAVDKVYLIRTGTALGDIHVAGRLSQTSCLLHPDGSPLLKKISTRSDRHLPEDLLLLREFCLYLKRQFLRKKYKNMKFLYVKSLYFRCISKIKKFRTKIPDLGTFFVRNSSFLDYLHQTNLSVTVKSRLTFL